jgi:hypothetical protein
MVSDNTEYWLSSIKFILQKLNIQHTGIKKNIFHIFFEIVLHRVSYIDPFLFLVHGHLFLFDIMPFFKDLSNEAKFIWLFTNEDISVLKTSGKIYY